ncbi:MAG: pilus assembly protein N-terminal domain-containing protein [Candidatus Omnitrophica bacterium]|nr:pilus assembly protein N-terminal domain-containing protein [Candidatus Omnitrophota bacterium]
MARRIFILFVLVSLIAAQTQSAHAYYMTCEILLESGIKYYNTGRYELALQEFKKALIANPDFTPAREYIDLITGQPATEPAPGQTPQQEILTEPQQPSQERAPAVFPKEQAVFEALERFEQPAGEPGPSGATGQAPAPSYGQALSPAARQLIRMEEQGDPGVQVRIEKQKSIVIQGRRIARYLAVSPDIVLISQASADELVVEGANYGSTYVHVWDENGRRTFSFIVVPRKIPGPTYDELLRTQEEHARNFKLRYSVDWSAFEDGEDFETLSRAYYLYTHSLSITGDTPYGVFDSSLLVQQFNGQDRPASFTLGLEQGSWNRFKGFSIRAFDFTPSFSNMSFPGAFLRGAQFASPVAGGAFDYTVFWGREQSSGFMGSYLSPEYIQTRDAYLSGANISFTPAQGQRYAFSLLHGYGSDRDPALDSYGYDAKAQYSLGQFGLNFESAFDGENFASQAGATFVGTAMQVTQEFRDIAAEFHTMTGIGWRAGELGSLTSLVIRPMQNLDITSSLDVFRDRLYPNPEDENRWNQDFYIDSTLYVDPLTRVRIDYTLLNDLGRLTPLRSHNAGLGLYRTFDLIKRISTYATYRFQDNTNFVSENSGYTNDKALLGLRLELIHDLYYFLSQEFNWTRRKETQEKAHPRAMETGLDWTGRIDRTPFFSTMRLVYRDEEDTGSPVSFLAGQDYLEWYGELSYRPRPEVEAYCSSRLRRIWPQDPARSARAEWDIRAGMRYLWDTGMRWEPVGMIEGFVFKDYNFDGIKQGDEPAVSGVLIRMGKDKFRTSNEHGYYLFPAVKARKTTVQIDASTIPANFTLTTPATRPVGIVQSGICRVDFGVASRTEITGMIFEDVDLNDKFSAGDKPIKGASVTLENGVIATTDSLGKYVINKVNAGSHKLSLDLRKLPPEYIPTVSIFKDVELLEGASFVYNFPLKKVKK